MRPVRCLFGLLLAGAYVCACRGWLGYVVYYKGLHSTFLWGEAYRDATIRAEGVTGYVNQWLTAMMAHPWAGIILIALLCAAVYYLTDALIRAVTRRPDYAALSVAASIATFMASVTSIDRAPTAAWLIPAILALLLLITLAVNRMVHRRPLGSGPKWTAWLWTAAALAWSGVGYWLILSGINRSERTMILTEQALREGRYGEVVDRADRYLASHSNKLMQLFRNYALARQGVLPQRIMEHPQKYGVEGLALPWRSDTREAEYGSLPYEATGHITEAQRWETEALVAWGATPARLIRLARYNILLGRKEVADKMIRLVEKAPFRAAEAARLREELNTGRVDGLRYALRDEGQEPARWVNVVNFPSEILPVALADSSATIARQYLLCSLLLRNEVTAFAEYLKAHPEPGPLPPLYEEALMIASLKDPSLAPMVSADTRRRFEAYAADAGSTPPELMGRRWDRTYWFYINHLSPHGRNAR